MKHCTKSKQGLDFFHVETAVHVHGLQVEIVRFRTDTEAVGTVISERAATLCAAAVVSIFFISVACI